MSKSIYSVELFLKTDPLRIQTCMFAVNEHMFQAYAQQAYTSCAFVWVRPEVNALYKDTPSADMKALAT